MSPPLTRYAVGVPWPYPHPGAGMQAILEPVDDSGLDLTLAAACDSPTPKERTALAGPLRLAVLASPPLIWIALDAGAISWDAPYAAAVAGPNHAAAIRVGATRAATLDDATRALVTIAVLDRGIVASLRIVSLSRAWWRALAAALLQAPDALDRAAYARAIAADQAQWTTAQMIARAAAVERGGVL